MNKLMTGTLMTMAVGAFGLLATQQASADTVTGHVTKVIPASKQIDIKSTNGQTVSLTASQDQVHAVSKLDSHDTYQFEYDGAKGTLTTYNLDKSEKASDKPRSSDTFEIKGSIGKVSMSTKTIVVKRWSKRDVTLNVSEKQANYF